MKHKLLYYFGSHLVYVVTSHVLEEIVGNHLATGWIAKWALGIMGLNITPIKSQTLADFEAEWTETQQPPTPVT
jgi:hypothetical protein